ncbi:MAG: HDIG domain-containing protein [Firmicutes bacterium]|nr:HDIG domain-containing protein [Bacillota bacterium]
MAQVKQNLPRLPEANTPHRRLAWAVLFFVLLAASVYGGTGSRGLDIQENQVASQTIRAPRDVVNRVATERKRQEAAAGVQDVYVVDPEVSAEAQQSLTSLFLRLQAVREQPGLDEAARAAKLKNELAITLPDSAYATLVKVDDASLSNVEGKARDIVQRALSTRMRTEEEAAAQRTAAEAEAKGLKAGRELQALVAETAKSVIRPNTRYDENATLSARAAAAESVPPVMVLKGQAVVEQYKQVTPEQITLLRDLGLLQASTPWRLLLSAALVTLLVMSLVAGYLYQYRRDLWQNESRIALLGLNAVVTLLISLALSLSPYLAPIPAAAMLVTVLLESRLALVYGVGLSLLYGVASQAELSVVVAVTISTVVSVYSVSRLSQRSGLMRAGLLAGAASALAAIAFALSNGSPLASLATWYNPFWGLTNGLLSSVLTTGSLPFFESFFGVVTPLKLLELANPNHPLLRKLLVEAPGTYHHTLMVANLAEAAVEAVGGDALLTRVGAYYHDIGKSKRPYFFIDNQFGGENPHDHLSPHLSALIISSHVRDGVEMGRQAKLPAEIVKFIPEHHGTTLISYFYNRATENAGVEQVLEKDFRYDGPKPQSKETAILMLADSTEAAVRSLKNPDMEKIEGLIRKIIRDRLSDGQLDESDLTLKDLDVVAKTFIKVLAGVYHSRIQYPETEKELAALEQRRAKDAGHSR